MDFKELKDSEAELFLRTKDSMLRIELPSKLVEELESLKEEMKADDLLEVLIKSTKNMIQTTHSLKTGDYEYGEEGKNCKIEKTSEQ